MKAKRTAWTVLLAFVYCSSLKAQIIEYELDGQDLVLSWEGDGVLQFALELTGPWTDDVAATSPHRVGIGGDYEFFRVFYPNGFQPNLEPPGPAFAEPNALPSLLGHELAHALGTSASFRPEVGDEVLLHSGETRRVEVDLHIKGRGMDFIWARWYRSGYGLDSAQGKRWDFSYNVHIEGGGPHVKVFEGNSHSAYFLQQSDGSYAADQFFREGRFDSNGVFRLTFADTGLWEFLPLNNNQADAGKLSRIADRNGNQLTFAYDSLGRLTNVTDTLNRNIQVTYNGDGFIESVTDFTGRQVRYDYYQDFELGGSAGDLKSARSPIVTGTPTLNDFPLGKITTYTYSEGFADEQENHLLLSIIDPKGQTTREYVYQHNQSDFDFLRCRSMRLGYSSNLIQFHYAAQVPSPSNKFAVGKVTVNDRMGNVSEHSLDLGNRLVMLHQFSGRADPNQPTTETLNRPMNALRTNDPPFFETQWEWNTDSLLTRVVYPNGNSVSNVYASSLNPSALRRARGNLYEQYDYPGLYGGDQSVIRQSWTYDPRFGTDARHSPNQGRSRGFGFVTYTDPTGNTTSFGYESRGNCTNVVHRLPTIVEDFEFNNFGQLTARVFPDNGSGHRRRDAYLYYTGGSQAGYLQQHIGDFDSGGLNQTTAYTYDAVGNVLSVTDPSGNVSLFTYNALDQRVHAETPELSVPGGSFFRQTMDSFFDANDNLVRVCEGNADELGQVDPGNAYITQLMEYDVLDRLIRICAEVGSYNLPRVPPQLDCASLPASEFATTEYHYDANWNLAGARLGEASEGRQPGNTVHTYYDERDLPFRTIRGEGDVTQSSTQNDYDRNGNLTITYTGLEAEPRVSEFFYDGYNRCTNAVDAMGNVHTLMFNPNGVPVRACTYGETNDLVGALGNIRLNEVTNVFDAMDRLIRRDVAFFDTATGLPIDDGQSTARFTYSDSSQLLTRVDDNNRTNRYSYDRLHRLSYGRDALGNEVHHVYDANSNPTELKSIEMSDLGNPDQTFVTRYIYDDRDRLIQASDNISNAVNYAYDSRNNTVLMTDPLGTETRYDYDGLNRLLRSTIDLNGNGPNPAETADIVTHQAWDDSSRLLARTDDNTNVTTYVYDALNRLLREVLADGTGTSNTYDVHDNRLTLHDANGNAVSHAYDLLNRLTNKIVIPGAGVSSNTTFERFRYDGLSRLVRAEDDDSLVELAYNSLGSVLQHRLNGQSTTATYDGVGNTLRCTYPGGRIVGYAYDPLNRIHAILDASNTEQCTYDFIGPDRMERMDYANQTRTDYFYDGVTGVPNPTGDFGVKRHIRTLHTIPGTGAVIDDRRYLWDRRYSKTARIDQRPAGLGLMYGYGYDAANRMNSSQLADSPTRLLRDTRYALDGVGNRIAVTNNSVAESYTMELASPHPADFQVNQYTVSPAGSQAYDENGNLSTMYTSLSDVRQFEFDYANRLVRFTDRGNNLTNEYTYDPLGRRTATRAFDSEVTAQVTRYFYGADMSSHANALQVVEEQDALGATLATYVFGGGWDDVLNMQRGGNDYHFHHDDLGNVVAVSDALGGVVERYEYGDYGEPVILDGASAPRANSAIGNPYLFTGRRYDKETGLYYFRSRYLDPKLGRFISRDRLGTWGDAANMGNALSYVGNNPWSNTDPLGLAKEQFVRNKPHVNIGTIGHVNQSTAAGRKPKEIVVVGSKVKEASRHPDFLWSPTSISTSPPQLASKKLFVGGLSWGTDESHKRKQSLYFPESMLVEIKDEAAGLPTGKRQHMPIIVHKQTDSPSEQASKVTVRGWNPGTKFGLQDRVPVQRSSNPRPGTHTAPSQINVILMGAVSAGAHPDFLWSRYANSENERAHVKVRFPWLGSAASHGGAVDGQDFMLWQRTLGVDPDQPIITGGFWNGMDAPASSAKGIEIQVGFSDNFLGL